jgi:hypothetical protein
MEINMKTLLATLAAVTLLASPALAAPRHYRAAPGYDALNTQPLASQAGVVVSANRVLGQDPDQNIRTQLIHEGEVSSN